MFIYLWSRNGGSIIDRMDNLHINIPILRSSEL